jgi:transposase
MASITRRQVKGHTYYYAVASQRIDGKPRLTLQKCLGSAEKIIAAVEQQRTPVEPREIDTFSFGGVAATLAMAERLRLLEILDRHLPKRQQGISPAQYLLLAAINRCTSPKSKRAFAHWYASTSLLRLCPVPVKLLSSQRFWDHMHRLKADTFARIEADLVPHLLREFHLDLHCLAYDATNFFTFIDTFNPASELAQRGKSKEHRADLRIIGVALLVSLDFHVPLFHHTYPGNQHDSKTLASVMDDLVERYHWFRKHCRDITLIFDKGNNSTGNLHDVETSPYHFVGSLPYDDHPELLKIPRKKFQTLDHPRLAGVEVWRTKKSVFGVERTLLVIYNPNLYLSQTQTVARQIQKRTAQLHALQLSLRRRREGTVRGGKKPTQESVTQQVRQILRGQHMKKLIRTEVGEDHGHPTLAYRLDHAALDRLQRQVFGKTILFTDQQEWNDADIILAYRGQSQIEDAFRTMKNPQFISLRPMYHWTDAMIRVHVFYCVLALTITSLLQRELHQKGIAISVPHLFHLLNDIREVALIWPRLPGRPSGVGHKRDTFKLSRMSLEQTQIFDALGLSRFAPKPLV